MRLYSSNAPTLTQADIARFWSHVDRSGGKDACWPWTAHLRKTKWREDYGQWSLGRDGKSYSFLSHLLAYELTNGAMRQGLQARHTCNNPACCNPKHMTPGTAKENASDRDKAGTTAKGERHGSARLNEKQVRQIRQLRASGVSLPKIADLFGVTHQNVLYIVNYVTWKHI